MKLGEYGVVFPFKAEYNGQPINTLTPSGKFVTRNNKTAVFLKLSKEIN